MTLHVGRIMCISARLLQTRPIDFATLLQAGKQLHCLGGLTQLTPTLVLSLMAGMNLDAFSWRPNSWQSL